MTDISCPAPECEVKWPASTPPEVLIKLLDIHERTAHPANTPPTASCVKAEKVKRPSISASGTTEEWTYFKQRWSEYKQATRLTGQDTIFQLLECCDETLRRDLSRSFSNLTGSSEATLLENIKSLAVRQENVMVARLKLQQMRQDRDEPVRAFAARINGQASVCQYSVKCECDAQVSYSDPMIRDTLIVGLADDEIRLDVLGQTNQDMSLEETTRFIEAKESGKRSAGRLNPVTPPVPVAMDAASTYKQAGRARLQSRLMEKKNGAQLQLHQFPPCGYCGKEGHSARKQDRMQYCPAFSHICTKCGIPHHFESICRSRAKQKPSNSATAVFEDFDAFCSVTLEHHVYDAYHKTWEKRRSAPQPTINVDVQALPSDAEDLGVRSTLRGPTDTANILAVADTGCQSCLAGTSLLRQLGLHASHLTPTTMKMRAANQAAIGIIGALAVRITHSGKMSRQIVYITGSTDKFFLSLETCKDLGLIPDSFPSAAPVMTESSTSGTDTSLEEERCNCPPRQAPPSLPNSLPFPATEENRGKLEQWLLDYYRSSTFNVCEHQTLPMMSGPPMRLLIDEDATPVAHHSPIPVPIH